MEEERKGVGRKSDGRTGPSRREREGFSDSPSR